MRRTRTLLVTAMLASIVNARAALATVGLVRQFEQVGWNWDGADGRFLGDVRVPDGPQPFPVYLVVIRRVVIGVAIDEAGVVRVKRYRLVLPGEQK